MCLPTGQWHLIRTQPAPTTPPHRPPALPTLLTTTPGITLALRPRRSHWIGASGQPTSPKELEGPQQEGDMWPPSAGPHQDTVSRLVEIQQLMGQGSSQLRTTEPDTGRFANSWMFIWLIYLVVFLSFIFYNLYDVDSDSNLLLNEQSVFDVLHDLGGGRIDFEKIHGVSFVISFVFVS